MKRLLALRTKLKAKQAESVIRARNYGIASRNLAKVVGEIKLLKERIEDEKAKLESVK